MVKLSPQACRVVDLLTSFSKLSQMGALHEGVQSLTARIAELRRAGYEIERRWAYDGRGHRYGTYRLLSTPSERRPARR